MHLIQYVSVMSGSNLFPHGGLVGLSSCKIFLKGEKLCRRFTFYLISSCESGCCLCLFLLPVMWIFLFLNLWLSLGTRLLILATDSLITQAGVQPKRRPKTLANQEAIANILRKGFFFAFQKFNLHRKNLQALVKVTCKSFNLNDYGTSWKYIMMGKTARFCSRPQNTPCPPTHVVLTCTIVWVVRWQIYVKYCQQFMTPPATIGEVN